MNRTPMSRGQGFRRAPPPEKRDRSAEFASYTAPKAACRMADTCDRLTVSVPKECVIAEHEGYMNLVRAMACAHCGRPPRSQFCHADEGKGVGAKTDCRRGWPGCGDSYGRRGCHSILGSSGLLGKDMRRLLESKYAAQTRAAILAAGDWPKSLPLWPDETAPVAQTQE